MIFSVFILFKMYKVILVVLAHVLAVVLCYHVDAEIGIYDGEVVKDNNHAPLMASIFLNGSFTCGGTHIHSQFVLTAAHCFVAGRSDYIVKLNSISLRHGETYQVKRILLHQDYNIETLDNDIALIQIKNTNKTPLYLPNLAKENTALNAGDNLDIYGWGETEVIASPIRLRHVRVPVYDFEKCVALYHAYYMFVSSRMFCAGTLNDSRDTCNGDSGGPVFKGGVLVGVVSFGLECGILPGVYTRVSAFNTWIEENIEEFTIKYV